MTCRINAIILKKYKNRAVAHLFLRFCNSPFFSLSAITGDDAAEPDGGAYAEEEAAEADGDAVSDAD